jgi:hypothetical protein
LAIIVANEPAPTDERFLYAFYGALSRLRFQPVGSGFFRFLPRRGKGRVLLSKLVNLGSAGSRYLSGDSYIARFR